MTRLGLLGLVVVSLPIAAIINTAFCFTWAFLFLPKGAHEGNTESIVFVFAYFGTILFWPLTAIFLWWFRRNSSRIVKWLKTEI